MRIVFDNSTPEPLARLIVGYEISTCPMLGWTKLANGELLGAAEAAGFDLMITADQNLKYQQNLPKRRIALIVLGSNYWPTVRQFASVITERIVEATPGSYLFIAMPHKTRKRP